MTNVRSIRKALTLIIFGLCEIALINLAIEGSVNFDVTDYGTYYEGVKNALDKTVQNPYINLAPFPSYYYPPPSIVIFTPLMLLSFEHGKVLFTFLTLTSLLAAIYFLIKVLPIKLSTLEYAVISILFIANYPMRFTVIDGQVNAFILLLVILGFYFVQQKQDYRAGIVLGIGACLKITPIFLAIYWLFNHRFKVFITAGVVFALLSIIAGFQITPSINYFYWRYIADDIGKQGSTSIHNQSIYSGISKSSTTNNFYYFYLSRLDDTFLTRQRLFAFLNYSIVGSLLLAIFAPIIKRMKTKKVVSYWQQLLEYNMILLLVVIGSGLTWFHHYVILLFPLVIGWVAVKGIAVSTKRNILIIMLLMSTIMMNTEYSLQEYVFSKNNIIADNYALWGALMLFVVLLYSRVHVKDLEQV